MAHRVRRVEYVYTVVQDEPGQAYRLLAQLAAVGVNLLAFHAVPIGPALTQLALFPEDPGQLHAAVGRIGLAVTGPHRALLIQGDDELGALVGIHGTLAEARVNVYACTGVTDGKGTFGYLVYVRPEEFDTAARALGV